METDRASFLKYVFVCENEKEGACCGAAGAAIRGALKEKIKSLGLDRKIRVSRSGCLDVCSDGPNVLVMPDNIWFKKVAMADVDTIAEKVIKGVAK